METCPSLFKDLWDLPVPLRGPGSGSSDYLLSEDDTPRCGATPKAVAFATPTQGNSAAKQQVSQPSMDTKPQSSCKTPTAVLDSAGRLFPNVFSPSKSYSEALSHTSRYGELYFANPAVHSHLVQHTPSAGPSPIRFFNLTSRVRSCSMTLADNNRQPPHRRPSGNLHAAPIPFSCSKEPGLNQAPSNAAPGGITLTHGGSSHILSSLLPRSSTTGPSNTPEHHVSGQSGLLTNLRPIKTVSKHAKPGHQQQQHLALDTGTAPPAVSPLSLLLATTEATTPPITQSLPLFPGEPPSPYSTSFQQRREEAEAAATAEAAAAAAAACGQLAPAHQEPQQQQQQPTFPEVLKETLANAKLESAGSTTSGSDGTFVASPLSSTETQVYHHPSPPSATAYAHVQHLPNSSSPSPLAPTPLQRQHCAGPLHVSAAPCFDAADGHDVAGPGHALGLAAATAAAGGASGRPHTMRAAARGAAAVVQRAAAMEAEDDEEEEDSAATAPMHPTAHVHVQRPYNHIKIAGGRGGARGHASHAHIMQRAGVPPAVNDSEHTESDGEDEGEEDEMEVDEGPLGNGSKRGRGGEKGSKKRGGMRKLARVICRNCGAHQTPQWRCGPEGPRTLCNACGVRFKKGLPLAYWEKRKREMREAGLLGA